MASGITGVNACRLEDGSLLLVGLENLNPYLSIGVLSGEKRETFVRSFVAVLKEAIERGV